MMKYRVWSSAVLLAMAGVCLAQSWNSAYDSGLKAARALLWTDARQSFKQAAAYRPDDVSAPTILPGPPTAVRRWRNGSAYSPNFLAAYSEYRAGLAAPQSSAQTTLLADSAMELEGLMAKHQVSREAYYVLTSIYTKIDDATKLKALQDKYGTAVQSTTWRVDTDILAPEEISAISALGGAPQADSNVKPGPDQSIPAQAINQLTGQPASTGPVSVLTKIGQKFALVIGVQNSKVAGNLEYSSDDAKRVRDSLVSYAGYPAQNVLLITNDTAANILAAAKGLAARMPDAATLCLYYSGPGTNIDGKDYLVGADATSLDSTNGLVKKVDVFSQFFSKGTHIFSFFQVDRSVTTTTGGDFGSEQNYVGSISQMQATTPGDPVFPTYRNGKETGHFTEAFSQTLLDLQSNRIPILEFGWQLFYHMRRGADTGNSGGSSHQICTLPNLNNLASDAPF